MVKDVDRLPYEYPDYFKSLLVDGAVTTIVDDNISTYLQISFTKAKTRILAEEVIPMAGGGFQTMTKANLLTEMVKSVEVACLCHPGHGLTLASSILQIFLSMSREQSSRFISAELLETIRAFNDQIGREQAAISGRRSL